MPKEMFSGSFNNKINNKIGLQRLSKCLPNILVPKVCTELF